MSDYETRLDAELQHLIRTSRTAALATLAPDGAPSVSLVQYAIEPATRALVMQVGALAPHAEHMRRDPRVALLIPADGGDPARARVTLHGEASFLTPGSEAWQACRLAWLARFPETEAMASMLDLSLVSVNVNQGRQVSDFGAARSLPLETLRPLLAA